MFRKGDLHWKFFYSVLYDDCLAGLVELYIPYHGNPRLGQYREILHSRSACFGETYYLEYRMANHSKTTAFLGTGNPMIGPLFISMFYFGSFIIARGIVYFIPFRIFQATLVLRHWLKARPDFDYRFEHNYGWVGLCFVTVIGCVISEAFLYRLGQKT